jgi:hypothetical protein
VKLVWLNYDAFKAKLDAKRLAYGPLKKAVTASVAAIAEQARQYAPNDQNDLRKSLRHENDGAWPVMLGQAGSDLSYAPFMEYGTGVFAEGDRPGKGSHHPAGKHLEDWAMRHGGVEKWGKNPGAAVAAIIGRRGGGRGGLRPRRYLKDAVYAMEPKIRQNFDQALTEIQQNWEK